MSILVTGGAGYIGSHTVVELVTHQEDVVVVANLQTWHRQSILGVPLYVADIRDTEQLPKIRRDHAVDTVIHFAASSVYNIVFSSTAAVYGNPIRTPIEESDDKTPTNPYGETKLAIEMMLNWAYRAYGIRSIRLRYFNGAGAHPVLPIGLATIKEMYNIGSHSGDR